MNDQKLIQELVNRNFLEKNLADKILKEAELTNRSAEDLLYAQRLVDEETIAKVKSEILKIPYKKIDPSTISDDLLNFIPLETARNYRVVPIEKSKEMIIVGMVHPDDSRAQEALKFVAKKNRVSLGVYLITPSDFSLVLRKYAPYRSEVEAAIKEIGKVETEEDRVILEEGGKTEEAPIIKIVASTLRQAVEMKASDVHIEPQRSGLRIRFRIDGKLKEMTLLPSSLAQPVISRVKVLAKLKLDETRIPQEGRFRTTIYGRDIDYRVSTFPTPLGEKVAIRVLDPTVGLKKFEELGLNPYNYKILEEAINKPYGMILISGPTGSGKTTTLYAILQRLNKEEVNILSLEDPVEYFIPGVNQSQVKPEIGYDFSSGLREILRQDPDIIMVGEIRDSETASLAVHAALTGHLMFSTIHTNNAIGVIPRLIDLGVPPFLLSSSLNLMIAQRLVLLLCNQCKIEEEAPPEVSEIIDQSLKNLPPGIKEEMISKYQKPYRIFKTGKDNNCPQCGGKGTSGRIGIFEMFRMTKELEEIISKNLSESNLLTEAKRQGMISLRQDAILKLLEGQISIEEVLRETVDIYE